MKTSFTVTVETSNMSKVYTEDDPEKFTAEHDITEQVEAEFHKGLMMWVAQHLTAEELNEAFLNQYIQGFELMGVDGYDDLVDYGEFKVTILDHSKENKQPELLVDIRNSLLTGAEVPLGEEVVEEAEIIDESEEEDGAEN